MFNNIVHRIPPSEENPGNRSGTFATLNDGRILLAYARFLSPPNGDNGPAVIASYVSPDNGRTWSDTFKVEVENEGDLNVMSPSLLRLHDGRIALFYLCKTNVAGLTLDCRLRMRVSEDDGQSWSEPRACIPEPPGPGKFVTNNDRVVQLRSGRMVVPCGWQMPMAPDAQGKARVNPRQFVRYFYSDDLGRRWTEGCDCWTLPMANGCGLQEPGVIELKDGRLFGWFRTNLGCQWGHYSADQGETWSAPAPTGFRSPLSPLSMKRIPETGDLLAVWNDYDRSHYDLPIPDANSAGRTPLVAAISKDDGLHWVNHKVIEGDHKRAFVYIGIYFPGDRHALISYGIGAVDGRGYEQVVRRISIDGFYDEA